MMFRLLARITVVSRLLARMWRLVGYGGRRCHICRSSWVTHQVGVRWLCPRCAGLVTGPRR